MQTRRMIASVAAVGVCICASCVGAWAAPMYTVTDVGLFVGQATGINNSGQVVGWGQYPPYGYYKAFMYSGGSSHNLGILPGGTGSLAYGINNSGQVVGCADIGTQAPFECRHAFLYSGGQLQDLGIAGDTNQACAINDAGQIAGESGAQAFLYSGGQTQYLGTLPGYTWGTMPQAINNSNQVVGYSMSGGGGSPRHAFLYAGGQMQDLGTLSGKSESSASGINDAGEIVGYSSADYGSLPHAFLYTGGQMRDLGTLGGTSSSASDINNVGQVIGNSTTTGGSTHAFVYSGGVMTDLNSLIDPSSVWTLTQATASNDLGQIVCMDGELSHVLLLTPVPEPATLSLLVLGGLAMLRRWK